MLETEILADRIVDILDQHKAEHIVKIDVREIENCFCKFFVVCNGTSTTHVSSLAHSLRDEIIEQLGEKPYHCEGFNESQWVILDYGDVVVHVFIKELRDYYQLEDFWADGKITEIPSE
ncbi:MAG: ribosome silencing factor [Marinifilaceae bacterium]